VRRLALLIVALAVASSIVPLAQAAGPLTFGKAKKAARVSNPGYKLESCVRTSSRTITCELFRDRGAWRYRRVARVTRRGVRTSRGQRFCRVRGRGQRCAFRLPRR
jgi:hypothetical protein